MPPRCPFQLSERFLLEALIQEGWPLAKIARKMQRSRSGIRQEVGKFEKIKEYSAKGAQEISQEIWKNRAEKLTRVFTDEEEKIIREMTLYGHSRTEIKKKLRCSCHRMEKWFEENMPDYYGGQISSILKKISSMQEQISLLFDLIEEMKK